MDVQSIALSHLLDSPDTFPLQLNLDLQAIRFVQMNRQKYLDSVFLDDRAMFVAEAGTLGFDDFEQLSVDFRKPARVIFHGAFCGSTLLSRAIEYPGHCLVYREPWILHELAWRKRWVFNAGLPFSPERWHRLFEASMCLLSRTYAPNEVAIIKTTDCCTNLAEDVFDWHPDSTAVLLCCSMGGFLASSLASPERRQFTRNCFSRSLIDAQQLELPIPSGIREMSIPYQASFIWYVHRSQLRAIQKNFPGRTLTLTREQLASDPRRFFQLAASHLRVRDAGPIIACKLAEGLMSKDPKGHATPKAAERARERRGKWAQQMKPSFDRLRLWLCRLDPRIEVDVAQEVSCTRNAVHSHAISTCQLERGSSPASNGEVDDHQ